MHLVTFFPFKLFQLLFFFLQLFDQGKEPGQVYLNKFNSFPRIFHSKGNPLHYQSFETNKNMQLITCFTSDYLIISTTQLVG